MKVTYNWIKEFVDVDVPVEQLAAALVSAGIEVASVTPRAIPSGVRVGRVLTRIKHPDADKLSLCTVDVGEASPLDIVCGAPNVAQGMRVACATVGTRLAPDFVIKKAKIRGRESFGMLCSERELGISDDHEGLAPLPDEYAIGRPLNEYLPDDHIIEVELTPNRGDCLSVVGIAREVAAAFGKPLRHPATALAQTGAGIDAQMVVEVEIQDPAGCPRYMGRLVRGITIAPSPYWLKMRLHDAGLRPINNIVDITNYVLIEYGQPQHAFDYARIGGKKITVRRATDGLKFQTLDNTERVLAAGDLLICDTQGPVALAGVMGGAGSAIADTTTDVFLECAYFDPVTIRKTSKRLGLSTDSSYRFERGVDPLEGLARALDRAAGLMAMLGGGTVAAGVVDAYPVGLRSREVSVRSARVARVLGVDIGPDTITDILGRLGMPGVSRTAGTITVAVPPYRHDITEEADLIEEVGRSYGYDNIPTSAYAKVGLAQNISIAEQRSKTLRTALAYSGFIEAVTNSMTPEKWRAALTPNIEAVAILNPLSPDMGQMRTTMLGSMLQTVAHNINHKNLNNRFFDLGKTYRTQAGQTLPVERWVLGVAIEGNWTPASWNTTASPVTFFMLKGIIDALAAHAGLGAVTYHPDTGGYAYFANEAAGFSCVNGVNGALGRVGADALHLFDIKSTVYYAELDVTEFLNRDIAVAAYAALPRFPAMERDFCFVMADTVESQGVCVELRKVSDLVEDAVPFDVYKGEKLGAGLKSVAYSVRLRSGERTLSEKEAEGVSVKIVAMMRERFGAELRK